ncbi:hypothetical protein AVEN_163909-1 [Araneus ventricosus]|uniref:Uncharacterized protein n=1 Tax=Araneus ventricosus TaxID=182803 RepID=A0A4Y2PE73_ARAVE|nr:hypothetical protein AVEN_163909-1 [Araneus ventricosus]
MFPLACTLASKRRLNALVPKVRLIYIPLSSTRLLGDNLFMLFSWRWQYSCSVYGPTVCPKWRVIEYRRSVDIPLPDPTALLTGFSHIEGHNLGLEGLKYHDLEINFIQFVRVIGVKYKTLPYIVLHFTSHNCNP